MVITVMLDRRMLCIIGLFSGQELECSTQGGMGHHGAQRKSPGHAIGLAMGDGSDHMRSYVTLTIPGDLLPCSQCSNANHWGTIRYPVKALPLPLVGVFLQEFLLDIGRSLGLRNELAGVQIYQLG